MIYVCVCIYICCIYWLLLFSRPVMSDSLQPHGLQHARPLHPSLSFEFTKVHVHCSSDAIQPSHPLISSSHVFISVNQNTGASASALVLPVNIQGWFPLRLTGLILLFKGLSGVFSSSTVQRHQFFGVLPSLKSSSHNCMWPLEKT